MKTFELQLLDYSNTRTESALETHQHGSNAQQPKAWLHQAVAMPNPPAQDNNRLSTSDTPMAPKQDSFSSPNKPVEDSLQEKSFVQKNNILTLAQLEKRYVLEVLNHFKGNRSRTAKALNIGANTLWRKLKSWGVPPARGKLLS